MQGLAVAIIFVGTIAALYLRPFGAKDWHIAALGGSLGWLAGPLSIEDGLAVLRDSSNIVLFFLGLMLIAAGAEASGLYDELAAFLVRHGRGRPSVLAVLILGAAITAILSNDATPLVLTPAIFTAAAGMGASPADAAFAATFTADTASLALPISNPVNLLFFERFDMGFGRYTGHILPAAVAGMAVMGIVVLWKSAPAAGHPIEGLAGAIERQAKAERGHTALAATLVAALAAGYVAGGIAGFPLGAVALAGGLTLLGAGLLFRSVDMDRYRHHVSPGLLVFVCGLLVLVESVSAAGLLGWLGDIVTRLESQPALVTVGGTALVAAILSNLLNNWPAAVVLAAALGSAGSGHDAAVAGALIGCTIGANFTIVGSLSTVFWLSLVRGAGADVTPGEYAKRAALPTAGAMVAACLVAAALA